MKNLFLSTMFLLLCAGFALAQSTSSSNPSSSGTSTQSTQDQTSQPSSTQSGSQTGTASQSGTSQSDTSSMGSQTSSTQSNKGNKEKTITGCLESAGSSGQYMVKHKNKDITVVPSSSVSSEIANHVGHKVKLHGTWEQASASSTSGDNTMASNTGSNLPQSDQPGAGKGTAGGTKTDMGKNAREFRADRIEMVSDTCGGSSKSKDNTGSSTPKPY